MTQSDDTTTRPKPSTSISTSTLNTTSGSTTQSTPTKPNQPPEYNKDQVHAIFLLILLVIIIGEFFSAPAITIVDTMRAFGSVSTLRQLQLNFNLTLLKNGIFSMLRNLEVLNLHHNQINYLDVGVLSPLTSLALLDLTNNNLSTIQFKTFLSLNTYSTHIMLQGNPWNCDCDLQRVFRKLCNVKRLFLDDYDNLTCVNLDESHRNYTMKEEFCVAEMVTVLVITITVVFTVVAAIVMAEKKRKRKNKEKHWTEVGELSCASQD
ncbi:uncharacterized protein [Garra rufa]|uniref:uncharacterized protein n=1 Tax=Garra rufa TaxID=137080 RepID=UPI003CCE6492